MIRPPLIRTAVLLLALLGFTATGQVSAAEQEWEWEVDDIGPASIATPTGSGHFIGDVLWFSTRQTKPPTVAGLDPATGRAVNQINLPEGEGAWVTAASGTDLYVGTYTPAKVYRVDTVTGEVEEILTAGGPGAVVYAMDVAPDGIVYVGTYESSGGRIFSYDPHTATVSDLGVIVPGQDYVRALVADAGHVYAGIGSTAHLIQIDRDSGARTDITPAPLDGATFVSSLALHEGVLLGGISPRGQLVVVDTSQPSRFELVQAPEETYVVAVTGGEDDHAYFAARPSGTLYGYELWSGQAEALAVPAPEKAANGLTFHDGEVWGLVDGLAYVFDPATQVVSGFPLDAAGVPPSPERAMAIAATEDKVYVSGSGGVQVHDIVNGGSERIFVPGEAKSMWPTEEAVYLSVYTRALIYELSTRSGELDFLAAIGNEQTRPRDSHFQAEPGRLLVATEPDYGHYGGALGSYDVTTGELDVYRNIVPDQTVSAVTAIDEVAYIGSDVKSGLGTTPIADRAELAAVDIATGQVRWAVEAPDEARTVTDLVVVEGGLVGITSAGLLFGLDPQSGEITWERQVAPRGGVLTPTRTGIYTTDGDVLYRIWWPEPGGSPEAEVVHSSLAGEWYGTPAVAASPDGASLYAVSGRNLVRVDVPDELFATVDIDSWSETIGSSGRTQPWQAFVAVTVVDHQGHPLPGARIDATWESAGSRPALPASCRAGNDGSCVLRHTVADADSATLSITGVGDPSLPDGHVDLAESITVQRP